MALQTVGDFPLLTAFHETAGDLLAMLRERLGFRVWIVSTVRGGEWLAGVVEGDAYGIRPGHRFDWQSTLCSRMVEAGAPRFAADVQQVPAYACTPLAVELRIAAYVGVPLFLGDGNLLGTLCALDPSPRHDITAADLAMVDTCARVLTRAAHADVRSARQSRRLERAEAVAFCDALTGLYNRRGWDQLLAAEDSRCRRHRRVACVVSIDLDDLKLVNDSGGHGKGDELLRSAARVLRETMRTQDIAARVGGDEFAVLAVECDAQAVITLEQRIAAGLERAGVSASIGVAVRAADGALARTWREADDAMYRCKRERKSTRLLALGAA